MTDFSNSGMAASYPDDDAIARLVGQFVALSLPKAEWTHAAHFATALWLIERRPDLTVERDMPALIRAYNAAAGGVNDDHNGYHETITQASLRAARAFRAGRPEDEPLHATIDALMAGPLGRSDWLLDYWRRETLFSVPARRGWVPPDLAVLPF